MILFIQITTMEITMRIGLKPVLFSLAFAATNIQAAEIAACVVDTAIPENPVYYYLPTTGTKLRCEINRANYHPTLRDLYADGWKLVGITDPKVLKKPGEAGSIGGERPSPVLYMERETSMTQMDQVEAAKSDKKDEEKGGLFGLF